MGSRDPPFVVVFVEMGITHRDAMRFQRRLELSEEFEHHFVSQTWRRSIEETLTAGWRLLEPFEDADLKRISPDTIQRFRNQVQTPKSHLDDDAHGLGNASGVIVRLGGSAAGVVGDRVVVATLEPGPAAYEFDAQAARQPPE